MEKLLQTIIEPLVNHPEAIQITKEEHTTSVTYQINLHTDDVGKVIGKQGRIAKAIRTVVSGANNEKGKKVFVEID
ncbi:KH domain-containing protein [Macrococcoides caseolyticum]|uniref:KH domain-containing protein n=1 Tax=Macrococcoides caseolyticum TaxID=69966 RepID=UPI001F26E898|nr:KH domain-containing protein [Macrococcus caseolyticus]MCE4956771.1 KH domain-containing protein [Macrococcus caseolyticus]